MRRIEEKNNNNGKMDMEKVRMRGESSGGRERGEMGGPEREREQEWIWKPFSHYQAYSPGTLISGRFCSLLAVGCEVISLIYDT